MEYHHKKSIKAFSLGMKQRLGIAVSTIVSEFLISANL